MHAPRAACALLLAVTLIAGEGGAARAATDDERAADRDLGTLRVTARPVDPIFPDAELPDCGAAYKNGLALIDARRPGLQGYIDLANNIDKIVRSRIYTLTIHSEHGQELVGKLDMRSEELDFIKQSKSIVLKTASVLAISVPLVKYAADRASDIIDLFAEHPNERLPIDTSVDKLKSLHRQRENLIDSLRNLQELVYCEKILPYELTLNAIHTRWRDAGTCTVDGRPLHVALELERQGQIYWQSIPRKLRTDLPSRDAAVDPQFYTPDRLVARAHACQEAGLTVEPAPLPFPPSGD